MKKKEKRKKRGKEKKEKVRKSEEKRGKERKSEEKRGKKENWGKRGKLRKKGRKNRGKEGKAKTEENWGKLGKREESWGKRGRRSPKGSENSEERKTHSLELVLHSGIEHHYGNLLSRHPWNNNSFCCSMGGEMRGEMREMRILLRRIDLIDCPTGSSQGHFFGFIH